MAELIGGGPVSGTRPRVMACVGCAGEVPVVDGATHGYMVASPGCWQLYGQWAAEQAWSGQVAPTVAAHHVDCYAVQHPGDAQHDRRQRQSIAVHLISLCRLLEFGQPPEQARQARARTGRTVLAAMALDDWPLLDPPHHLGATTIADVASAVDGDDLAGTFTRWVQDCWHAWREHHPTVREWANVMARSG